MHRSLLRFGAAVALALLMAPAAPEAAPPPGLQYDEIVRVVVSGTPPPPGNFAADVAAIAAATPIPTSTPAPRKRGFGGLAGAILSGNVGDIAGSAAGAAVDDAVGAAIERQIGGAFSAFGSALRGLTNGRLLRYAFYNGAERVDDVAAQTASITKCDARQTIYLNLARKTYRIVDANAESGTPSPATRERGRGAAVSPDQPGTADITLSAATTALAAPRTIEQQPVAGYDERTTMQIANASGSCGQNGTMSVDLVAYYSRLATTACRPDRYPSSAVSVVAPPQSGCRPTFHAQKTGPTPPSDRLALYSLLRTSATRNGTPEPTPSGADTTFAFLTERGNLRTIGLPDAGLFEVPAGFTREP